MLPLHEVRTGPREVSTEPVRVLVLKSMAITSPHKLSWGDD